METFLFDDLIFGPITSRRLGNSLGINLLPLEAKFCNFDCVYCECGWTKNKAMVNAKFPASHEVVNALIERIQEFSEKEKCIDSITFAGNGEPTLHPQFPQIINDVVLVRDLMLPDTKISVLTNATMLHRPEIVEALMLIDKPILKLDAGTDEVFNQINNPKGNYSIASIKSQLAKFRGELCIQTLFFKGEIDGVIIDNSTEKEIDAWTKHIVDLNPKEVMIYSLDRNTPADNLVSLNYLELMKIAEGLKPYHIKTLVA